MRLISTRSPESVPVLVFEFDVRDTIGILARTQRTVTRDELSYDLERFCRVHIKTSSRTEKVLGTHSVRIEITSILITQSLESLARGVVSTILTTAFRGTGRGTHVRGDRTGSGVRFPDIHLRTTTSELSNTSVTSTRIPSLTVRFTVDELDIMRALRVAVSSSVLGSCQIRAGHSTVLSHLNKVQRTVQTTRQFRHVDLERELSVLQFEHSILVTRRCRHVRTTSHVLRVLSLRHEFQIQVASVRRHTVRVGPIALRNTVQRAVLRTCHRIGTDRGIPGISSVAVRVRSDFVNLGICDA